MASRGFYEALLQAAMGSDARRAEALVRGVMEATIPAWRAQETNAEKRSGGGTK